MMLIGSLGRRSLVARGGRRGGGLDGRMGGVTEALEDRYDVYEY